MAKVPTPPSVQLNAFDCPHCGAYAGQAWFNGGGAYISSGDKRPKFLNKTHQFLEINNKNESEDWRVKRAQFYDIVLAGGLASKGDELIRATQFANLSMTLCQHCTKIALWVHERLVYPLARVGVEPNPDLPIDLRNDFEEARSIVMQSPRGAAALMRLVIQKLCKELGESGKNIDSDIASLVSKGLNPMVQQALDYVRVIGNNAVHPGSIDLKDDPDTAITLFSLVNAIADHCISHPKKVKALFEGLPTNNLSAIAARDAKRE